jgi:hypothetical protein
MATNAHTHTSDATKGFRSLVPYQSDTKNSTKNTKPTVQNNDDNVSQVINKLYKILLAIDTNTPKKIFIKPNINSTKYSNLIQKIGVPENQSDCLFQYDNTVFGAGDDGFIVTKNILGWHNILEKGKYLRWKEIAGFTVNGTDAIFVLEKSGLKHSISTIMVERPIDIASCLNDLLKLLSK